VIYPCTIILSRYGGIYEGGAWVALPLSPYDVPIEVMGDDISCAAYFSFNRPRLGVGNSPEAALSDLERKLGTPHA